jgi:predicted nucleic acid-binding protein
VIVLVDTSVWAEYFRRHSRLSAGALDRLQELVRDDLVATVLPIRAEVLSGRVKKEREAEVRAAFASLRSADLDWNAAPTWEDIAQCAREAREAGVPATGIVDRMILLASERSGAALWTLDEPLLRLAANRRSKVYTG